MNNKVGWKICEDSFSLEENMKRESLYCLANGYFGIRGTTQERLPDQYSKRGTFINGFFEKSTIQYGESAYGFAKHMQTMLSVCDGTQLALDLDGERFSLLNGNVSEYHQELDMEKGVEQKQFLWESPSGKQIQFQAVRMVSMVRKHIAAFQYKITPLNFSGNLQISAVLDGHVTDGEETDDPRVSGSLGDGSFGCTGTGFEVAEKSVVTWVKQRAVNTGMSVICIAVDKAESKGVYSGHKEEDTVTSVYKTEGKKGDVITFTRYLCYETDQRNGAFEKTSHDEIQKAVDSGWELLLKEHTDYMNHFWKQADIQIKGNDVLTQSMRFNIFQLLQSAGRDGYTSIASKGLSGDGYGGHYFWESETYIAPVFMFLDQKIARKMLEYRYSILDKARNQAKLLGHEKGALYSWRSIDGEESSAYFPAGSAQYHINADVAFAVAKYMEVSQDTDFLIHYGLEILLETARLWIDVGHYSKQKDGYFCIDAVTGPDEYTAIVDNNCYTNVMARENLWNAVKAAETVKEKNSGAYKALCEKLQFHPSELENFSKAADNMYIPYDKEMGIHMQDDTFLSKKVLDLTKIPEDKFPLLLHYHPLFIYRHQVCKQADLLLAEYFLPDRFKKEDIQRDYEYYEKRTTHDSSLSACIFSIMAAETGNLEKAYHYFIQTVRTDLDDNQKNTKDGLHMANMAGAWSCMVHGFAGMKLKDGTPSFRPLLPKQWNGYLFHINYRDCLIKVEVTEKGTCYQLQSPGTLEIIHNETKVMLLSEQEVWV